MDNKFDWEFYVLYYEDIKHITNGFVAWKHFKKYGIAEKRYFNKNMLRKDINNNNFDWKLYISRNKDLKYINNEIIAWKHFINNKQKNNSLDKLNDNLKKFILNEEFIIEIDKIEKSRNNNLSESINYKPIIGYSNFDTKQKIPKNIYKIYVNDTENDISREIHDLAINSWKKIYPDYNLIIYDSIKINKFILEYYGEDFLNIYNILIPYSFKCDFVRYLLLYKFGGVYSDLKQVILERIDFTSYHFVASYEKHLDWIGMLNLDFIPVQNCLIGCIKNHPYIKCAIDMCIQNILNNRYNSFCTDITGPVMFGRCIKYVKKNLNLDLKNEKYYYFMEYKYNNKTEYFIHEEYKINSKKLVKHKYDNSDGGEWKELKNNNNYSDLWNNNEVYNIQNPFNCWKYDINKEEITKLDKSFINVLKKLNVFLIILDEDNIFYKDINNIINIRYISTSVFIFNKYIIINNKFNIYLYEFNNKLEILNFIINEIDNYTILTNILYIVSNFKNCHNITEYFKKPIEIYQIKNNLNYNSFKYNIKPYFIYFPQFHQIQENDINFYEGYDDIKNLYEFNKNNKINKLCETPNLKELGVSQYNLLDNILLQKQINILENMNFPGFAMYYYWFNINTITHKNMIFENVINKFFNEIDMKGRKIFFIWANENWSDTIALSSNNGHKIKNEYNEETITKNANNLINYFKKDCYLKIDDKPVFFLYHSWKLTLDEINLLYIILNLKCIESNFKGVHLVLNTMFDQKYNKYKKFYLNLNYKNNKYSQKYSKKFNSFIIDYDLYTKSGHHIKDQQINTIFYNFDNHPRFYKPDKLNNATFCINNSELIKYIFTKNIVEKYNYNKEGIDEILLINAWNEWGEGMVFEPSNEFGYYNINLLIKALTY